MPKKRKRTPRPKNTFDPDAYMDLLQSILLKAQLKEIPSTYLLEQLNKMDPEGTLAKRLKVRDLDALSMRDRFAVVWQVTEQTGLGMLARQGEIDRLAGEGLITVELIDWETYAKRTAGSKAIGPLKDLSATDILLTPTFLGFFEMVLGTVARRTKNDTPPEETSIAAALIYNDIKRLLNPDLVADIPGARKNIDKTGEKGDPSGVMMLLVLRLAMLLHLGFRHRDMDQDAFYLWTMKHSVPLFMTLCGNNYMYSLWGTLVRGRPQTRFVDNDKGGFYFEYTQRPE